MTKENQPEEFVPAKELTVTSLETLKVVSDALRSRLLDLLRAEAQTVKQLAAALNLSPKKLYYHINLMEQHGLIRVVSTRIVSGIIEKQYRATAYLFWFDKEIFASDPTAGKSALPPGTALLFDITKTQLAQSIENKLVELGKDTSTPQRLLSTWTMAHMAPEQAEIFYARLEALLEEFDALAQSPENATTQAYRLFLTLFPVRRYPEGQ